MKEERRERFSHYMRKSFRAKDICHLCTSEEDVLSEDDVAEEVDSKGRRCLLTCRRCLDAGVKLAFHGKTNQGKKRKQRQQAKDKEKESKKAKSRK